MGSPCIPCCSIIIMLPSIWSTLYHVAPSGAAGRTSHEHCWMTLRLWRRTSGWSPWRRGSTRSLWFCSAPAPQCPVERREGWTFISHLPCLFECFNWLNSLWTRRIYSFMASPRNKRWRGQSRKHALRNPAPPCNLSGQFPGARPEKGLRCGRNDCLAPYLIHIHHQKLSYTKHDMVYGQYTGRWYFTFVAL